MHVVAAISVEDSRFREPGLVLYECIPEFSGSHEQAGEKQRHPQ